MTARTIAVGGASYPLVLPNLRDPRLHVAAVIITVHVLGQVGLHFRVSIPQILAAIVTCAIIEVALTFRASRAFVWPASAMLTGSGVALILRVIGTPPDQPWNTDDWWVFAGVAGLSLLTKYVIKYRGSHVFNPSNIGLVVAFLVLGSQRVEPLDFWWGPLNVWLVIAYAVIIGGGLLITRRLKLLGLAAAFWLTLVAGIGLLAGSGHCMTANWAFSPVCGVDFWRVIVTSPEVLIFLFFMITDPKTVPAGRVGRIVFGVLVAVASTILVAPQTNEFGTKVALLSGLVAICAIRPILERFLPEPKSAADELRGFATRLATGGGGAGHGAVRGAARVGLARRPRPGDRRRDRRGRGAGPAARLRHRRGPGHGPAPGRPGDVPGDHDRPGRDRLEPRDRGPERPRHRDDDGREPRDREPGRPAPRSGASSRPPTTATASRRCRTGSRPRRDGNAIVRHYRFDSLDMGLVIPFGVQTGLSLGVTGTGDVTEETHDAAGTLVDTRTTRSGRPSSSAGRPATAG